MLDTKLLDFCIALAGAIKETNNPITELEIDIKNDGSKHWFIMDFDKNDITLRMDVAIEFFNKDNILHYTARTFYYGRDQEKNRNLVFNSGLYSDVVKELVVTPERHKTFLDRLIKMAECILEESNRDEYKTIPKEVYESLINP